MEKCKEREPTTVLEPRMFANVSLLEPENTIKRIHQSQNQDSTTMKQWREDVTGFSSKGWGMPIPGPRLRSPLETFKDCVHCGDKYHNSTMCPITFMPKRCPYCSGNCHIPTQCPNIITQAFNYVPRIKVDPIPIPPKPEEGVPTSSCYPERAIKPLPQRARESRP
jgi:hypothetical protein